MGGWKRVCACAAGVLGALLLAAIALPPFEVEVRGVESELAERLGCALELGSAAWGLGPWPELRLTSALADPELLGGMPIRVRVERAWIPARMPFGLASAAGEAQLEGVALDAGPFALRGGRFTLAETPFGTSLEGRASGALGGFVEVSGTLEPAVPEAPPLRIYLDRLRVPAPVPSSLLTASGLPAPEAAGMLVISGVVRARGSPAEGREVELDLRLHGLRAEGGGEWLRLRVRGDVRASDGRFVSDAPLELDGELLDVGGVDQLHVFRGRVRGQATLSGHVARPRLELVADLSDLRVRTGGWFEKAAGEAARLVAAGRWSRGELTHATADLRVAGARVSIERDPHAGPGAWHLESSWVPLGWVASHAPFLRRLEAELDGRARLQADLGAGRTRALVELRELRGRLAGRPLESGAVELRLRPRAVSMTVARLRFAEQEIDLAGRVDWDPEPGPIRVSLEANAEELDLGPLGEALLPIVSPDGSKGSYTGPLLEELTRRAAKLLRGRPLLLRRLRVESALLYARHLRGFGLDLEDARVQTVLADRQLRVEHSDRSSRDEPRVYAVDLGRFVPRLEDCRSPAIAPGGLRKPAARCPDLP